MRASASILPLLILSLLMAGCSNQTVVVGHVTSALVVIGLFYSTINLHRD